MLRKGWWFLTWIELGGVLIDITSDQFEERQPVFVAARNSWYTSWEEESRHLVVHHPREWTHSEEREVLRAVLTGARLSNSDLYEIST